MCPLSLSLLPLHVTIHFFCSRSTMGVCLVPDVLEKQSSFKLILEYCDDGQRIYMSWACRIMRAGISPFIPCRSDFRTLTVPTFLPGFFHQSHDGVWSISRPQDMRNNSFFVSMIHHVGQNVTPGVSILAWLSMTITVIPGSVLLEKTILSHLMMSDDKRKGMLIGRILDNTDHCINLDSGTIWELIENALRKNTSIKSFIFKSTPSPQSSYLKVFRFLGQRQEVTAVRYIDISGPITAEELSLFPVFSQELQGVAFRNFDTYTLVEACAILSDNALGLQSLEIDGTTLDENIEQTIVHLMGDLSIDKVVISNCTLNVGVFMKLMSVFTESPLDMLGFHRVHLAEPELAVLFFLPCIERSAITELVLTQMTIPDTICMASSIYTCLVSSKNLTHLNLYRSGLGKQCVSAVIEALPMSRLQRLNLASADIGDKVFGLYRHVVEQGKMEVLHLDRCKLPRASCAARKLLICMFKEKNKNLLVTTTKCEFY